MEKIRLLDPAVQLQIFHLPDFTFIASLDFVSGWPVDQCILTASADRQVCVRPSFLVGIKFQFALTTQYEVRFLQHSLSSTRSHHRQIPADVQLQVSFESFPRPFDLARSRRLHQCPFPFSSASGSSSTFRFASSARAVWRLSSQAS